ncbi:poly-gamma-glutamate biosynthesis protein PgsC/CapC [Bacillus cereus]|uniref:poly-gamma-glutamate biosynthesis protein PgsC/CapC n=1 Tax=Bacillus cereus TaxID=1396 RepID=UPI0020D269E7|nr:poly-gamma-glutamate biosynthesis protein PgsC/CapC [Bacillus cereus]
MLSGLVVPGYLAIIFNEPVFILLVLLTGILTYVIVLYGVLRITILYGSRKFEALPTGDICLKLILDSFYPVLLFHIFHHRKTYDINQMSL